jgi:uncharacterized protein YjiS (DUF1127 family)
MATIDFIETAHQDAQGHRIPSRTSLFAPLVEAFAAYRRRIEEHRIIVRLSRHDGHLLRDMGFEPDEIYDAVRDSWDEVPDARRRAAQRI